MTAYRIRIFVRYSNGGRVGRIARNDDWQILTFATAKEAAHVLREFDPYDAEIIEVKRGRVNADIHSRIAADYWRRWETAPRAGRR